LRNHNIQAMSNQFFSEEAIQKIIKRAAELQRQEEDQAHLSEQGLSMDELIKIGEEAGLDIAHIQQAAHEVSEKLVRKSSTQNDTHIFEERVIETTVSADAIYDEVRAELRQNFNDNAMFGNYKEQLQDRELVYNSMSGIVTTARVSSQKNGVKIQMSQRVGLGSSLTEGVLYGGIVTSMVFGILFAIFKTNMVESIAMFSSLMVLFSIVVYALDVGWRNKKQRQLGEILDKIVDQIPTIALPAKQQKRTSHNDTSSITIEEPDVYDQNEKGVPNSDSPLKQNLRD
jgi:hypothetical protein